MGSSFSILSLFSGGGGLDLGIHRAVRGARTVVYVEREAFACEVLAARMEEGALAPAPIWTDVCTFDGRPWRGVVDCVAGGSPCQDLSVAGKRAGLDGERSGLFFQFIRIVEEVRPGYVFWENVGGAASALPRVFDAFAALGYSGKAVKLRASDVGASHQRARVFLLGKLADAAGARLGFAPNGGADCGGAAALGCWVREPERAGAGVADPERAVVRLEPGRCGGANGRSAAVATDTWRDVADAACDGRGEGRSEPKTERRTGADDAGADALAHGHGHGCEGERRSGVLDEFGSAQRNDLDRRSGPLELADSDSGDARREGRERAGAPCEGEGSPRPAAERRRPLWPPGPGGDWSGIDPRFFPAQPRFRGVADGVARGLVESVWADRLRMLGNGVVPAQAAEAWRFLFAHLGG